MTQTAMKSLFTVTTLAAVLAGCSLAPKYERPVSPVEASYPIGTAYNAPDQARARADGLATADLGWRNFYSDPLLQKLIAGALASNRDLRVAALNVDVARAQYRIQRSELLPGLGVGGTGTLQRLPADLSPSGSATTSRSYQVGATIPTWEIDLFGRIRSLSEQALQSYFSLEETRQAMQLSLIADVASAYLNLRADQELLQLTEETLVSQRQSFDLTRQAFEGGIGTSLELSQAEVSVRTAEQNYAVYTRLVALDLNALTFLVGESFTPELHAQLAQPSRLDDGLLTTELPAGLPSDLLIRRPDIRAAERDLRGANANIGAARAAFFPSITLTGSAGTASASLGDLFGSGSGFWSFSPQISLPLFSGGALQSQLDVSVLRKDIGVARYEQAVQAAFREVSDALAGRGTLDEQIQSQRQLVDANQRAYQVSDQLFREGVSNYLAVLDSQRSLYSAQQQLVQTRLERLNNLVTLYKVLGGGWSEVSVAPGTVAPLVESGTALGPRTDLPRARVSADADAKPSAAGR